MTIVLTVERPDEVPVRKTTWDVYRKGGDDPEEIEIEGNELKIDDESDVDLITVEADYGFWSAAMIEPRSNVHAMLLLLPLDGPVRWWHRLHGIEDNDVARGRGVRIGVIDEALAEQDPEVSCIGHVRNHGDEAWGLVGPSQRALKPLTAHGHAIVSFIASTCGDTVGAQGMAPGAEVHFCAAGHDTSHRINIPRLLRGIEYLSDRNCHLISISAGDCSEPLPEVRNAVQEAWSKGCLCFFAAGNNPEIKYPAIYDECLSVTALGERGYAPIGTAEHLHESLSETTVGSSYRWYQGARGAGTDFAGAGSNVVWPYNGQVARAVTGTSYACPITVGAAATVLSRYPKIMASKRNSDRSANMLEIIKKSCLQDHNPILEVTYGILKA